MKERENMEYKNTEYREIEERLSAGQEDYRKIPVPEEMKTKLEAGISLAEAERKQGDAGNSKLVDPGEPDGGKRGDQSMDKKKIVSFRIAAAAAAAAAILVVLPNTGAGIAHAMGGLPVVGKLFQAVTFRDYQYESDRFDANVEVPQIVVDDMAKEEKGAETETGTGEGENADKLQETVDQINFDIEKVTDQLIVEFQESADLGESYGSLEIHHETVTNNERYFTLKLSMYQGAGSGYESYKFYTIDKRTGKQIQIGDLFIEGSDYLELLSENLRDQMRAKMAEDEMYMYWVDYEDVPGLEWKGLKEDQNFYFDEDGNLVISFDEYEVAPGYMGAQEFTVEKDVFEKLLN